MYLRTIPRKTSERLDDVYMEQLRRMKLTRHEFEKDPSTNPTSEYDFGTHWAHFTQLDSFAT